MDDESEVADKDICTQEKELSAKREVIRSEMNECIREFVEKLPENYRTVIILSELKDLKNQEIAEILGISLDAVKIRLHRARERLKKEFKAGVLSITMKITNWLATARRNRKSQNSCILS